MLAEEGPHMAFATKVAGVSVYNRCYADGVRVFAEADVKPETIHSNIQVICWGTWK